MITTANEYMKRLQDIQNQFNSPSLVMLPTDEPRFIIDANERTISIPDGFTFLGVLNDHNAETVYFEIDRYYDQTDLSKKTCIVQYESLTSHTGGFYTVVKLDVTTIPGKIIFGWEVQNDVTAHPGDIEFAVRFYSTTILDDDKIVFSYNFNTEIATLPIKGSLDTMEGSVQVVSGEIQTLTDKFVGLLKYAKEVQECVESVDIVTLDAINAANTATQKAKEASSSEAIATEKANAAISCEQIVVASKEAAAASEQKSKTSEQNARSSEKNAAKSEASAISSAEKAKVSETNAAASETNAATSAASAKESADKALSVASPPDKTLTQENVPAEAKSTGDALKDRYTKSEADAKFSLNPATADTLGGVKIGTNLTISEDGTLNGPTLLAFQWGTTAPTTLPEGTVYIQYST